LCVCLQDVNSLERPFQLGSHVYPWAESVCSGGEGYFPDRKWDVISTQNGKEFWAGKNNRNGSLFLLVYVLLLHRGLFC